jgi:hypothetical protein
LSLPVHGKWIAEVTGVIVLNAFAEGQLPVKKNANTLILAKLCQEADIIAGVVVATVKYAQIAPIVLQTGFAGCRATRSCRQNQCDNKHPAKFVWTQHCPEAGRVQQSQLSFLPTSLPNIGVVMPFFWARSIDPVYSRLLSFEVHIKRSVQEAVQAWYDEIGLLRSAQSPACACITKANSPTKYD